ncbi:hypothetical protein KIN20_000884 [Parelaphostrongylus tenuis]|uniref:7TM GPCR serpentine receptor class x (Srx) domain-containing protein n=1 Tax=Parelaphostrongylus tenuis TaxID=148309 RepID=A0AAD5QC63_PARTN|nr:hypothetical protein KIN20_000884 [Parelaphostrongylus tenuis]
MIRNFFIWGKNLDCAQRNSAYVKEAFDITILYKACLMTLCDNLRISHMEILSSIPMYIHSENIAVSAIMVVIGVFGLVSNTAAILSVRYNPALRSSFGLLCLSHSIANMGSLLIFVFWITPITLLPNEDIFHNSIGISSDVDQRKRHEREVRFVKQLQLHQGLCGLDEPHGVQMFDNMEKFKVADFCPVALGIAIFTAANASIIAALNQTINMVTKCAVRTRQIRD